MSLKRAIKDTIEYAAKFGSYINKKEIEERLISRKYFSKEEIKKAIGDLNCKSKKNIFYEEKLNKALDLASKIKADFKDILFLGLSGSVASGHPKKNDDIDILIITKTNSLWKTRLCLRWWIYKNKVPHRKYGKNSEKNQFCFNLWLDENNLLLPKDRRNLKNSVDLILLKPLINKNEMYEKFLLTNNWAEKWVATGYARKVSGIKYLVSGIEKTKIKNKSLDKFVNYLYFWPQYCYMKRKIRKEKVGLYQAFFHQ